MKTGNVIFVIFLWIVVLPIILLVSITLGFFNLFGGESPICTILIPILFVILTLVILLMPEKSSTIIQNTSIIQSQQYSPTANQQDIQELFELAQDYNYKQSDIKEALEIYKEIIRKYPYSNLSKTSKEEIEKIEGRERTAEQTNQNRSKDKDESLDLIRMRFAKGEITEQEYEKMKKKLEE